MFIRNSRVVSNERNNVFIIWRNFAPIHILTLINLENLETGICPPNTVKPRFKGPLFKGFPLSKGQSETDRLLICSVFSPDLRESPYFRDNLLLTERSHCNIQFSLTN